MKLEEDCTRDAKRYRTDRGELSSFQTGEEDPAVHRDGSDPVQGEVGETSYPGTSYELKEGVGILELPVGSKACFCGFAKLQVKSGRVWLMGKLLGRENGQVLLETDWVHSPPLLIEAVKAQEGNHAARISFFSLRRVENLDRIINPRADEQLKLVGYSVQVGSPVAQTIVSDAWRTGLDQLVEDCIAENCRERGIRVAICGSKGMGKSTVGRLAVNALLNAHSVVAFLETDVGQPEFTPPGLVSLAFIEQLVVGPPHTHQVRPVRSHFVGDTSPKTDTDLYSKSVSSLLSWFEKYCQEQGKVVPLVVNTNGWIQGIGFKVLSETLCRLQPTHLIQMTSSTLSKNLPGGNFWLYGEDKLLYPCMQLFLPSVDTSALSEFGGPKSIGASECRDLMWLEFSRQCVSNLSKWELITDNWDDAFSIMVDALCKEPPFVVPARSVGMVIRNEEIPKGMYAHVLNSSIVGLLERDGDDGLPNCLGLGLIRGIDQDLCTLYILTPVPDRMLKKVSKLVLGNLEFPTILLESETYPTPYICHWSIEKLGTGSGNMRSHSNKLVGSDTV